LLVPLVLFLDLPAAPRWLQDAQLCLLQHLLVNLEWLVGFDGALVNAPAVAGPMSLLATLELGLLVDEGSMMWVLTSPCWRPSLLILTQWLVCKGSSERANLQTLIFIMDVCVFLGEEVDVMVSKS